MKDNILKIVKSIGSIAVAFLIAIVITKFIIQMAYVQGQSMEPNFYHGEQLLVLKSPLVKSIERFDVVVVEASGKNKMYIKRIIGLPGETIQVTIDGVYINGELLEDQYASGPTSVFGVAAEPITLGDNEYFIMGDNRNHSLDSRDETVGPIQRDEIIGKMLFKL